MGEVSGDWRKAGAFAALVSLLVCSAVVIKGGGHPVELGSVAPQEAIAQPPPLPAAAAHPEALALAGGAVAAQPSTTEHAAKVIADARAALSKPATEQQLHWGHKYLAKYGLVEKGWDGCKHTFASLCHGYVKREDDRYGKPWFQEKDWLDYGSRLRKAHDSDEEMQIAFHNALQQLHKKVMDDRVDKTQYRQDRAEALKAAEDAIKARWQKEEDDNAATLVKEREEMDETQAKVNAAYIEKIANMSTGRKEYAELLSNAHAEDEIRQAKFKQVIADMKASGASPRSLEAATSEFGEQERLFQTQLEQIGQAFKSREHEVVEERREAKEALNSYDAEQKRESEAAASVERQNAATEAAAAKEAISTLGERTSDNGKDAYEASVAASKGAEKARAAAMQKDVEEQKKKEALHEAAMAKRAAAEQKKSQSEAAKTTVANSQESAVGGAVSQQLATKGVSNGAAAAEGGTAVGGVGSSLTGEEKRRLAFFDAMAKKAAAQFQAMPTSM